MCAVLKSCLGICLSLVLVLTGQSMALARGTTAATGQMVICVGTETVTVYVDAEGKPTSAPHLCPDCVLSFHEGPSGQRTLRSGDVSVQRASYDRYEPAIGSVSRKGFLSRAPPVSV